MYKNLRVSGRRKQAKTKENSSAAHKRFADAIAAIELTPEHIDFLLGLPERSEASTVDGQRVAATRQDFSHHDDNELNQRAKELLFEPVPAAEGEPPSTKLQPTEFGKKFIEAGAALSALFHKKVADETWTRGRALFGATGKVPRARPPCDR